MSTNCSSTSVAQYLASNICEAACLTFDDGTAGDTTGNTLGCRQHHAELAGSASATECPIAGPGGNGTCGSNCTGYCQLMMSACPAEYADEAACMTNCATWTGTDSYTVYYRPAYSVSCALYGASRATIDPSTFCSNASEALCP